MKDRIREQIKEKIKAIPLQKKQEYSFHITQEIIERFGHLNHRHIYVAMTDEVDTAMLISHLKQAGKKIFTPSVEPFHERSLDIIIVPGRAFTHNKKRLGRGKGYYDRFLAKYSNTPKIGICFPEQIVEDIPIESHDILMDEIITAEESPPLQS